jgi:hypothetical protein
MSKLLISLTDPAAGVPPDNCAPRATALAGLVGTLLLIGSFVINPGLPSDATLAEAVAFGRQHASTILLGGWMQGLGSVLSVLFAVGIVQLTGYGRGLAGWLTVLSGAGIVSVSLLESALYFTSLEAGLSGSDTVLATSRALLPAVQHLYLIVPALLLPVGWTLWRSRLLPRLFAVSALVIGAVLQVLGVVGLFWSAQPIVDDVLIVQGVWFVAASLALAWQVRPAIASVQAQSGLRPTSALRRSVVASNHGSSAGSSSASDRTA